MHVHPVARAWAEALLEIARERNSMDEIGGVLLELADWVEQHDDIRVLDDKGKDITEKFS